VSITGEQRWYLCMPAASVLPFLRWVLTVPAIWDDEARAFMRYSAEQAGIGGGGRDDGASEDAAPSRLALALEPEAAAIAAVPGVRSDAFNCIHLPGASFGACSLVMLRLAGHRSGSWGTLLQEETAS